MPWPHLYDDGTGQACRQKRRQDVPAKKNPGGESGQPLAGRLKISHAAGGKAMNHGKEEKRAAKSSSR